MTFTHGASGYNNYSCRCDVCTAGNRERQMSWRRRQGVMPRVARGRSHGFRSTYNHDRCRCLECREAEALYRRSYRARSAS